MVVHTFQQSQVLDATLEECWSFFSDPRNLARITPPALDFTVLSELPPRISPALMIRYRVRPLFGIPLTWLTEITLVDEPHRFVDEQRVGPYRLWHHEHTFVRVSDTQTEVRDLVHYALPWSPWSELLHPILVAPQLRKIFAFRERAVPELIQALR